MDRSNPFFGTSPFPHQLTVLVSTLGSIRARLCRIYGGQNIAPMLHRSHILVRPGRVNVLKKVKVDGKWKLFPAVVESDGRLKTGAPHQPFAGAELLFHRRLPRPERPDTFLVVLRPVLSGKLNIGNSSWRCQESWLLSFSECDDQQEAMLLLPAHGWIESELERFRVIDQSEASFCLPENFVLIRVFPTKQESGRSA